MSGTGHYLNGNCFDRGLSLVVRCARHNHLRGQCSNCVACPPCEATRGAPCTTVAKQVTSKSDEAFLAWKESRKTVYDRRQYFAASDAFAAACEWQREQCLQAVEQIANTEIVAPWYKLYQFGFKKACEIIATKIKGDL